MIKSIKQASENNAHINLLLYLLVGGGVFLIDLFTFSFLLYFSGINYLIANTAAKLTGAICGYFLHSKITFSWEKQNNGHTQMLLYSLLSILSLFLANFTIFIFIGILNVPSFLGKILSDTLVIITVFLANRFIVFKKKK